MDPHAPTDAEIVEWAHSPLPGDPLPNWDLHISTPERLPVLIRLAEERHTGLEQYFENCLYLALRHLKASAGAVPPFMEAHLHRASVSPMEGVRDWADQARQFLTRTSAFAPGGSPAERRERECMSMRWGEPCSYDRVIHAVALAWRLPEEDEVVVTVAEAVMNVLAPGLTESTVNSLLREELPRLDVQVP